MGHSWKTLSQDLEITEITATLMARRVVAFARRHDGIDLDYTPHSLLAVDQIVESFRADRTGDPDVALLALGCYVGEVVVRQAGGYWRTPPAQPAGTAPRSPVVLCLPGGGDLDPIEAVYGRFERGPMESVFGLFRSLIDLTRCA